MELVFAIRIVSVETKVQLEDEGEWNTEVKENWTTLTLKMESVKLNPSEFKPISSDMEREVINTILENSENIHREDLPLENQIIVNSNKIALRTRRGAGNFAIFSESYYEKFLLSNPSSYKSDTSTINGTIKCYVSTLLNKGILVGYMGSSKSDCGIVISIMNNTYQISTIDDQAKRYYKYIE